jgi:hypothetical protein
MRFETLNTFFDRGTSEAELSPAAGYVWVAIWRHARPDGRAEISVESIVAATRLSRSTVLRGLKELKAKRMLQTKKKGGIGRGASAYALFPYPRPAPK